MDQYLLAVHKAVNLTHLRYRFLTRFFHGDWKKVWKSKIKDWQAAEIDKAGIEKFFSNRNKVDPVKVVEQLGQCGAKCLFIEDEMYPLPLKHIYNPPVVLFYRGQFDDSWFPSISVVGSRKVSSYGKRALARIVSELVQQQITIVSGLAYGVDTLAHKVAIEHSAKTIAVLGSAIDNLYPAANRTFAEQFLADGTGVIFSEYFPGTQTRAEHFPQRNRIVAGLSKATIIIEAAAKSGSLITAKLALEQGKEVFAVPGEIFASNSAGTNGLIARGEAQLAYSGGQILQHMGLDRALQHARQAQKLIPTSGLEGQILELFQDQDKIHINDIVRQSGLPVTSVGANLSLLEIKGFLRHLGESVYGRNF